VGDAINAGHDYTAASTEFACKAGTAAIQMCAGLVKANYVKYGLAIGADTAQGAPETRSNIRQRQAEQHF